MKEQRARPDKLFHCFVSIIDGLGNAILYDHTIPDNVDFKGFLERLQVDTFQPLFKIHDESDYTSWAKRVEFLSSDKAAIAKLKMLIEQYKITDYDKLGEWLWICKDRDGDLGGNFITGEKEFKAFMALANLKKLSKGCLMRVSESKFREITTMLKCLEIQEDRKGLEKCEEAFREMEMKQSIRIQSEVLREKADHNSAAENTYADNESLDWGSESEVDQGP